MHRGALLIAAVTLALGYGAMPAVASAPVTNTTITSGPIGPIATDTATFEFVSPEEGGFECRLDSIDPAAWSPCASPQTYGALAEGGHVFEVRTLNMPGNVDPTPAVAVFAVETAAPETTITFAPGGTIASETASFEFASSQPGSFECRLDSAEAGAWSPCASPQTYESLAQGPHSFEVRAVNAFGHADPTPAEASFAVDTRAPETTITSGPTGTVATASAAFEFSSSEPGSFECSLDAAAWSPCTSPQSYESLADGSHGFEVRAIDSVGNVDPTPARAEFNVDTGPPPPIAGKTIDLEPVEGTVELQCPGEGELSRLTGFRQVPLGCLVNARNGVVDLTASRGSSGVLQGGHFWGGMFVTHQEEGDEKAVELTLAGRRMCERRGGQPGGGAAASRAGGRRGGRKLWGSGKGNFKTSGSYGSATVRGTTWLVIDRCDASTLFKVREGTVWVHDSVKETNVVLTTGQQYLAKAPIPRLDPELWP